MYFGNPEKFSICWDEIYTPEVTSFRYGYISLVAGMQVLGGRICHATLGPELVRLSLVLKLLKEESSACLAIIDSVNLFEELVWAEENREEGSTRAAIVLSPWALFDLGFYSFFLNSDDGGCLLSGWVHDHRSVTKSAVSREEVIAACTSMIELLKKNPDVDR